MRALYNQDMKITTKTGDKGDTRLYGGKKVHKSSPYIDILGDLDLLHSYLGWAKLVVSKEVFPVLGRVQNDVYRMMSIVGYEMKSPKSIHQITKEDTEFLEKSAEKYAEELESLHKFIEPGSTEASARLHIVRAMARKTEYKFLAHHEEIEIPEEMGKYLNRLSDFLFALAFHFEAEIKTY